MEHITDSQQALFTMGLSSTATTMNIKTSQNASLQQRQTTNMAVRPAHAQNSNTRGNVNSVAIKASANTRMSAAQPSLGMSASGQSQPSAQGVNIFKSYSTPSGSRQ